MADTADSKSAGLTGREGSSPSSPTNPRSALQVPPAYRKSKAGLPVASANVHSGAVFERLFEDPRGRSLFHQFAHQHKNIL